MPEAVVSQLVNNQDLRVRDIAPLVREFRDSSEPVRVEVRSGEHGSDTRIVTDVIADREHGITLVAVQAGDDVAPVAPALVASKLSHPAFGDLPITVQTDLRTMRYGAHTLGASADTGLRFVA